MSINVCTSQLLQYGAGSNSDHPCQRIVCRRVDSTRSWRRAVCRSVRSSVLLISSNSLGSVALMLRARFHERCVIGTMDFIPSTLLYSYRSSASWYWRHVNGPTFHAMLLHQPSTPQQSSLYSQYGTCWWQFYTTYSSLCSTNVSRSVFFLDMFDMFVVKGTTFNTSLISFRWPNSVKATKIAQRNKPNQWSGYTVSSSNHQIPNGKDAVPLTSAPLMPVPYSSILPCNNMICTVPGRK